MTRNEQMLFLHLGLNSALGAALGTVLAIAFGQYWYLGTLSGAFIAGLAYKPREVGQCLRGVVWRGFQREMILLKYRYSDWARWILRFTLATLWCAISGTMFLATVWFFDKEGARNTITHVPTGALLGVACVWGMFQFYSLGVGWLVLRCLPAAINGSGSVDKNSQWIFVFPLLRTLGYFQQPVANRGTSRTLKWWEEVAVLLAVFVAIPIGIVALSVFVLDLICTVVLALATTHRLAVMTGALIGALVGYASYTNGWSENLPIAVMMSSVVGFTAGPAVYRLRELLAQQFASWYPEPAQAS